MAKSKFTKGPLSVKENNWQDDPWEIFAGDTYIGVAIETGVEGEAKANAELWADAPRMLEALRALCAHAGIPQDGTEDVAQAAFDEAVAILEKHGG